MIAKIITGKSFSGAVRYLLEKSGHARMIDTAEWSYPTSVP